MHTKQQASSVIASTLIAIALVLRGIDLLPPLVKLISPYIYLYRIAIVVCIVAVLILERHNLSRLYVTRHSSLQSLSWGFPIGCVLGFSVGSLLAIQQYGFHWINASKLLPTFGISLGSVFEELIFRSYLLSRLSATRLGGTGANIVQTVLFVAVHPRYFVQSNWLMVVALTALAFLAGKLTLRTRNIVGAWAAHTACNFTVFLPIGGQISFL